MNKGFKIVIIIVVLNFSGFLNYQHSEKIIIESEQQSYENEYVGKIEFVKTNQINNILLGTDNSILDSGNVGLHYLSQNLDKENNHLILAGHNRNNIFSVLLILELNDIVKIHSKIKIYTYKVINIDKKDKDFLFKYETIIDRKMTLITCIENNNKRLLITLKEEKRY